MARTASVCGGAQQNTQQLTENEHIEFGNRLSEMGNAADAIINDG